MSIYRETIVINKELNKASMRRRANKVRQRRFAPLHNKQAPAALALFWLSHRMTTLPLNIAVSSYGSILRVLFRFMAHESWVKPNSLSPCFVELALRPSFSQPRLVKHRIDGATGEMCQKGCFAHLLIERIRRPYHSSPRNHFEDYFTTKRARQQNIVFMRRRANKC